VATNNKLIFLFHFSSQFLVGGEQVLEIDSQITKVLVIHGEHLSKKNYCQILEYILKINSTI